MNPDHAPRFPIVSLDDLDLRVPDFNDTENLSAEANKKVFTENYNVVFKGVAAHLSVTTENTFSLTLDKLRCVDVLIKVSIQDKVVANLILSAILKIDGTYEVARSVRSWDEKPKGLGMSLWEMGLKLIQKYSDKMQVSFKDKVIKEPSMGLSPEKWDELFLPLLEKYSYVQTNFRTWEKIYLPKIN
jgi:hypothetical protein